jgi:Protein of unknown function (DUF3048) N-terminal domain/Protein of unknown function (DUF3048) C-terminal domain
VSRNTKIGVAVGCGVLVLAAGAFLLLKGKNSPLIKSVFGSEAETCPLSGEDPNSESLIERPALAVKIENNPSAYPLSGLEDAEIVYEELVEGGLTRFLALYHCTDSNKAGPVRSARAVDPAIVGPITHILAAAGGNDIVRKELDKAGIHILDESTSGDAMRRIERPGLTSEHTLYGETDKLRKLGEKRFDDAPSSDLFEFGDLEGPSKKIRSVTLVFSGATEVTYEWQDDAWVRFDDGEPLPVEGAKIAVDNVIIEEHTINLSNIVDTAGNRSIQIEDVTGSGRAVLFRDGRMIEGKWVRDNEDEQVRFATKGGDALVLARGTTWIELLPDDKGEVKGSFSTTG